SPGSTNPAASGLIPHQNVGAMRSLHRLFARPQICCKPPLECNGRGNNGLFAECAIVLVCVRNEEPVPFPSSPVPSAIVSVTQLQVAPHRSERCVGTMIVLRMQNVVAWPQYVGSASRGTPKKSTGRDPPREDVAGCSVGSAG